MKVKCVSNIIDNDFAEQKGMISPQPIYSGSLTIGKLYTVLGMFFAPQLMDYFAGQPAVEIKDDVGNLSSCPLFMFEVVEQTPSKYWKIKYSESGNLTLYPESFYQEYYHDDLSEGIPEVEADFVMVCETLEKEAAQLWLDK